MRCETIRGLLSEYIDGLTDEDTKHMIEAHMATCHDCHAMYEDMLENRRLIGIMAGIGPSPGFTERVVNAVKESLSPYLFLPVPLMAILVLTFAVSTMGQAAYRFLAINLTIASGVLTSIVKLIGSSIFIQAEMISALAVVMIALLMMFGRLIRGARR